MTLTTFLNVLGTGNLRCSHALVRIMLLCLRNFSFHIWVDAGVNLHVNCQNNVIVICNRLLNKFRK